MDFHAILHPRALFHFGNVSRGRNSVWEFDPCIVKRRHRNKQTATEWCTTEINFQFAHSSSLLPSIPEWVFLLFLALISFCCLLAFQWATMTRTKSLFIIFCKKHKFNRKKKHFTILRTEEFIPYNRPTSGNNNNNGRCVLSAFRLFLLLRLHVQCVCGWVCVCGWMWMVLPSDWKKSDCKLFIYSACFLDRMRTNQTGCETTASQTVGTGNGTGSGRQQQQRTEKTKTERASAEKMSVSEIEGEGRTWTHEPLMKKTTQTLAHTKCTTNND